MTKSALHQALSSAGISPPEKEEVEKHLQPIKCMSLLCAQFYRSKGRQWPLIGEEIRWESWCSGGVEDLCVCVQVR